MGLDPLDHQILGFQIARFLGGSPDAGGAFHHGFVAFDQVGHEVLRRHGFRGEFGDRRQGSQRFQTAGSKDIQRPDPFRDLIHRQEKLFILSLEGRVQAEKRGAFDVPVGKVRLAQQGVGIRQNRGKTLSDGIGTFLGMGGGFHRLIVLS